MGILNPPVLAIEFTNTTTGMRIIVGPFVHASIMSDLVRAVRVGEEDDEIVAECDGRAWYHANLPYTDFVVVPWIDGVRLPACGARAS